MDRRPVRKCVKKIKNYAEDTVGEPNDSHAFVFYRPGNRTRARATVTQVETESEDSTSQESAAPSTSTPRTPADGRSYPQISPLTDGEENQRTIPTSSPAPLATGVRVNEGRSREQRREGANEEAVVLQGPTGSLFVMGNGCLGEPGVEKVLWPQPIDVLEDKPFQKVVAGTHHALAVQEDGSLWSWGSNKVGQLGRVTEDLEEQGPAIVKVPEGERVLEVAAGESYSAILTSSGKVLIYGVFEEKYDVSMAWFKSQYMPSPEVPYEVPLLPTWNVVKIAGGLKHLLLLTRDRRVISLGSNDCGQLGRGSRAPSEDWRKNRESFYYYLRSANVHFLGKKWRTKLAGVMVEREEEVKIKEIYAGPQQSWAVSVDDRVFGWGQNRFGELGIPPNPDGVTYFLDMPTVAPELKKLNPVAICGGIHHTLILDSEGKVFSCGQNQDGRLGLGKNSTLPEIVPVPQVIPKLEDKKIVKIRCGHSCSFAVTGDGVLYSWGKGEEYQLGTGALVPVYAPDHCKTPALDEDHRYYLGTVGPVFEVAAGENLTVILLRED